MAKRTKAEQAQAIEYLREYLKPGDEVRCVLRHVSSSGMSRDIDLYRFEGHADGTVSVYWLSGNAAKALGLRCDNGTHNAVRISGAGMDMGFALVYDLAQTLWPNEDRSGYLLKHRWL